MGLKIMEKWFFRMNINKNRWKKKKQKIWLNKLTTNIKNKLKRK